MRKLPKTVEPGPEQEIVSPPLSRTLRVDELKKARRGRSRSIGLSGRRSPHFSISARSTA